MPIDEKQRLKKQQAGQASGDARSRANAPRNENICLAFVYLTGGRQSKRANKRAEKFLKENGFDIDSFDGKASNPCQILADCTGIKIRQILNIMKAGDVRSNEHNDREENIVRHTLASRLREARETNKLTKQRAASKLGISPVELGRYESGEDTIPYSVIKDASNVYGETTDFLFGINDEHEDGEAKAQTVRLATEATNRLIGEHVDAALEYLAKNAEQMHREDSIRVIAKYVSDLTAAILAIEKSASRLQKLKPGTDVNISDLSSTLTQISLTTGLAHQITAKLVRAGLMPSEALNVFSKGRKQD